MSIKESALVVVDVQNDFVYGALAVQDAEVIIAPINYLLQQPFHTKIATQDWHPENHISFTTNTKRLWPFRFKPHCIQNTDGAKFVDRLQSYRLNMVIRKGMDEDEDQFFHPSIKMILDNPEIRDIYVCGLVRNVCVYYTARDIAVHNKYQRVYILEDATKPICFGMNSPLLTDAEVSKAMVEHNIKTITTNKLLQQEQ